MSPSAADDAVVAGIQTVTRLLGLRTDGTRGLYVDPTRCPLTLAECASYQYPPAEPKGPAGMAEAMWTGGGAPGAALSELPLKAADHAMDATPYALHSEQRLLERPTAEEYLRDLAAWAALRRRPKGSPS